MTNHQSKIEKLIAELCPNGVEFKMMKDIVSRNKGTKITASQMKVMHVAGAQVKIFAGGKTFAMVAHDDIPKKDIHKIPSVIVKSRGIIEFEYYDKPFSHKNEFWSYFSEDKNINIKYVFYYLKTKEVYFQKLASKMQMPQISLPDTEDFKIPLPPLAIQEEIVSILDSFTELEAELEARKKQYEHYRAELLVSNSNVKQMTLGEVCDISIGQALGSNTILIEGSFPFINAGIEPSGYLLNKNTEAETITIPSRGQGGSGHVGYQKTDFWCGPLCYRIKSKNNSVLTKYLYYYLKSIQDAIIGLRQTGSIPAINRKEIVLNESPHRKR